jgi:hypothetical protein
MLLTTHNLGMLSDRQFDSLEDAYDNLNDISFTTNVWVWIEDNNQYLLTTFKDKDSVIIGNRISKNNNEYYYLIINETGKLLNKIRL